MINFDNKIIFVDKLTETEICLYTHYCLHILCIDGKFTFSYQGNICKAIKYNYVIVPETLLASSFTFSKDFKGIIMFLADSFVSSIAIGSNYGVIGHLSLLQNPIMKLSSNDFTNCYTALKNLKQRISDIKHLFYNKIITNLLVAHILDLFDIHARTNSDPLVSDRTARLLRKFIELLHERNFIEHKDLDFYAKKLFITPHYLSEICKKVSKKPAGFWIDRFLLQEILRLLSLKEISLTEIADKLNFSSYSYFCRYVQKKIGVSPSQYRNRLH